MTDTLSAFHRCLWLSFELHTSALRNRRAGAGLLTSLSVGLLLLLLASPRTQAQTPPAPVLPTEHVFTIEAAIGAVLDMGVSVDGTRRSIPITGGSVHGEQLQGEVLPGGADYQVTRTDGSTLIRAVYMLRTDDGELINVVNEGYIVPPGTSGNATLYFRTVPHFTAPNGKYGWLNHTVFVSAIRLLPERPGMVIIDVYRVL